MPRYVAFLRAVNVGGRFVKMADLRAALVDGGFGDVETHIQSGNVHVSTAMRSPAKVAATLEALLAERAGFEIPAIVRTPRELASLLAQADGIPAMLRGEPKRYLALASGPVPGEGRRLLEAWDRPGEALRVLSDAVLGEFSIAFHTIRLTNARLEKMTGLTTTWRDLAVVRTIAEKWSD